MLLAQVRFPGAAREFSFRVNFQCRLTCGVCTPQCAIACIKICAHVKDPLVHVRILWIMETLKQSACSVGLVAGLCCSWLSLGKAAWIFCGKIPMGQNSSNFFFFFLKQKWFFTLNWSLSGCSLPLWVKSRKWLAQDILYLSATHVDLLHKVTYSECQTQNCSAHNCFRNFQALTVDKVDHKWTERLLWVYC